MMLKQKTDVVVDITGQQMLVKDISPSFNTTFLNHETRSRKSSDAEISLVMSAKGLQEERDVMIMV